MADDQNRNNNNGGKRGRGRPAGSPNKLKSVTVLAKNRELAREEVKKLINLFVIKKMQKIDDLYDSLGTRDQAKMLTELMKYSTPTSSKDVEVLAKENEKPKQITEIKISYEKPQADQKTIDITPIEDADTDSINDADDDVEDIDDTEPF
ncbi:hypothetical protein [Sphingobacterium chungjuense]|uniref:hypothetical protein n=1 Tax=Sphingobacterium chungjuense TaxID=2675553 RepID=UPI00140BD18D|nr:hypothetical protein [Sphingobacterium chungjuense]